AQACAVEHQCVALRLTLSVDGHTRDFGGRGYGNFRLRDAALACASDSEQPIGRGVGGELAYGQAAAAAKHSGQAEQQAQDAHGALPAPMPCGACIHLCRSPCCLPASLSCFNSRRSTLPTLLRGRSSRNSMSLGTL